MVRDRSIQYQKIYGWVELEERPAPFLTKTVDSIRGAPKVGSGFCLGRDRLHGVMVLLRDGLRHKSLLVTMRAL